MSRWLATFCLLALCCCVSGQPSNWKNWNDTQGGLNGWKLPDNLPEWLQDFLSAQNTSAHGHHSWGASSNPFVGPYRLNLTNLENYEHTQWINATGCNTTVGTANSCPTEYTTEFTRLLNKISYEDQVCAENDDPVAMCRDVLHLALLELPHPYGENVSTIIDTPLEIQRGVNNSNLPEGRRLIVLVTTSNTILLQDFNLNKIVGMREDHLKVNDTDYSTRVIRHVMTASEMERNQSVILLATETEMEVVLVHHPDRGEHYNGTLLIDSCFTETIAEAGEHIRHLKTFVTYRGEGTTFVMAYLLSSSAGVRLVFRELFSKPGDVPDPCQRIVKGDIITWHLPRENSENGDYEFDSLVHSGCGFSEDTSRTLIMIRNSNFLWILPYNRLNVGPDSSGRDTTLRLSPSSSIYNGSQTNSVNLFGQCDVAHAAQSIWFVVVEQNNMTILSSQTFSQHNFDCPDLSIVSSPNCTSIQPTLFRGEDSNGTSIYNAPFTLAFDYEVKRTVATTGGASNNVSIDLLDRVFFVFGHSFIDIVGFQTVLNVDNTTSIYLKPINRLHPGSSSSQVVSPNGHHVFIVQEEAELRIESIQQSIRLCQGDVEHNGIPEAVEKEIVKAYCRPTEMIRPTAPNNVTDYVRHYTMCSPNTHICPTFSSSYTVPVPKYHVTHSHLIYICPPGSYCIEGIQYPCPRGFTCPIEGTIKPLRCEWNANFSTTCDRYGLPEPLPCPDGFFCWDPAQPPIPAPPGYYYGSAIDKGDEPPSIAEAQFKEMMTSSRRIVRRDQVSPDTRGTNEDRLEGDVYGTLSNVFHQCPLGWWCQLANSPNTSLSKKGYGLLCPEGNYCPESSIMKPIPCETETHTTFCPSGSHAPQLCPDGKNCYTPYSAEDCHLGDVCLTGSPVEKVCPKGFYCRFDFTVPRPCGPLALCPEGTSKALEFLALLPTSVIVLAIVGWVIFVRLEPFLAARRPAATTIPVLTSEGISHQAIQPDMGKDVDSDDEFSEISESQLMKSEYPIDIHVSDVGYTIGTRPIITGVSGSFQRGKLSAIMGPSGCGKSTLMSILCGRVGQTNGEILINGTQVRMSKLKTSMGFVPQSEIMLRTLTVWETIYFYARIKTTRGARYARLLSTEIIEILGLTKVQHTVLGDEKVRGISGGELKRVSIGIEMVGQPSILFLDEPTTGLDSTVALQIVTYLKKIASLNITVICVIHQPRAEIFKLFDNVLLLSGNGKPSYFGPTRKAKQYFTRLGYSCKKEANVADFLLDVASGKSSRMISTDRRTRTKGKNREQRGTTSLTLEERGKYVQDMFVDSKNMSLGDLWSGLTSDAYKEKFKTIKEKGQRQSHMDLPHDDEKERSGNSIENSTSSYGTASLSNSNYSRNSSLGRSDHSKKKSHHGGSDSSSDSDFKNSDVETIIETGMAEPEIILRASANKVAPAFIQWYWFMYRSLKHQLRTPIDTIVSLILFSLVGLAIGMPARSTDVTGGEEPRSNYITCTVLYGIGVGLISVQSSLRVFGPEQLILWRESRSGINRAAYFLAKNIAQLPFLLVAPLCASAFYTLLTPTLCPLWYFYSLIFCMVYAASGFGYLVSTTFPPENGLMIGILYPLIAGIFAGARPELGLVARDYGLAGSILVVISYGRWHLESLFVYELQQSQSTEKSQLLNRFLYSYETIWRGPLIMLAIGTALRILAFIMLVLSDQGRIFADKRSITKMMSTLLRRVWRGITNCFRSTETQPLYA
ncbi:abc transporter family protein [Planoprotostelium fungivorum]|uniref:Abc transporter family protein n=1 Tax=Planoprotostelium fungivorum TaxID=1890364 RepID=A0A2P6N3J8_9EUKA|nr:abc transporter family protein [Planoprotostelium fungivorum]